MRQRIDRRRGGAAIVALVCLSVIAMVVAGLLRLGIHRAEQLETTIRRSQADWLVEAGLDRTFIRLCDDSPYDGEIWEVSADALGGRPGRVVIEVEQGVGTPPEAGQTVRIRAEYPSDGDPSRRVRRSKIFLVRPIAGIDGGDS